MRGIVDRNSRLVKSAPAISNLPDKHDTLKAQMNMPHVTRYVIDLPGQDLPLSVRKHARARRITLRFQPLTREAALTLPRYVSVQEGLRFVEKRKRWLAAQINACGGRVLLTHGASITVMGEELVVTCTEQPRGVVTRDGTMLRVPGKPEYAARRVREWLMRQARAYITQQARLHAVSIGRRVSRVSLRDTVSRWGSCDADGKLSFSWRLVFAPRDVLDYVICHEVAHLEHMNHSPEFWCVVEGLCPHWRASRRWLKTHGHELYQFE